MKIYLNMYIWNRDSGHKNNTTLTFRFFENMSQPFYRIAVMRIFYLNMKLFFYRYFVVVVHFYFI